MGNEVGSWQWLFSAQSLFLVRALKPNFVTADFDDFVSLDVVATLVDILTDHSDPATGLVHHPFVL